METTKLSAGLVATDDRDHRPQWVFVMPIKHCLMQNFLLFGYNYEKS